jgi:hypothetical protein
MFIKQLDTAPMIFWKLLRACDAPKKGLQIGKKTTRGFDIFNGLVEKLKQGTHFL